MALALVEGPPAKAEQAKLAGSRLTKLWGHPPIQVRMHGVDQHESGHLIRMTRGEKLHIEPAK